MDFTPREMPKDGWVITDIRKSGIRNSYKITGRAKGKGTYSYWVYDEEIKKAKKLRKSDRKIVKESSNVAKFRRSIEAAKNRIIRKVERNGVVENLGQDEVRRLKDTLDDMVFSGSCEKSDEIQMGRMLDNFDDWASTYTGKVVKEADGMGMSYDELMAKFLEIQKKLGKKSKNTFVYWTYEPMDEGVQEYLDRKGYEPMGTWYSVQYSSELCWPTGAWLGSKHEKTRRATSVQELCDWFEKNQEKLGGRKFIGALSGYENVNDIKIENGRVVVVFGKTEDVITEGDEGYDSDTPKIYVGTYAKYNDGSIDGKWIDLT